MTVPAVTPVCIALLFAGIVTNGCSTQKPPPASPSPPPDSPLPAPRATPREHPSPTAQRPAVAPQTLSYYGWRTNNAKWLEPKELFDEVSQAHLVCLALGENDELGQAAITLVLSELSTRASMTGRTLTLGLDRFQGTTTPPAEPDGTDPSKGRFDALGNHSAPPEGTLRWYAEVARAALQQDIPVYGLGEPARQGDARCDEPGCAEWKPSAQLVAQLVSNRTPAQQVVLATTSGDCVHERLPAWVSYSTPLRTISVAIDRTGAVDLTQPLPPPRIDGEVDYQIIVAEPSSP